MVKWILIVVAVLVGFVVLLAVIGLFVPKGHVATRTIKLRKTPREVWAVITDFAGQAAWRTELTKVERLADRDGHVVWVEFKGRDKMPLETLESVPSTRLVRKIADPKLPFGGTWTYELRDDAGGCALTITENGEVYNPIFRTVSKFFDMRATMDGYLKALGKKFGEEVELN